MPMNCSSLFGDLGSSLSGGQNLAYPAGAGAVQKAKEKEINDRLRHLGITRISVAHRPGIMSGADKVLRTGMRQDLAPAASAGQTRLPANRVRSLHDTPPPAAPSAPRIIIAKQHRNAHPAGRTTNRNGEPGWRSRS